MFVVMLLKIVNMVMYSDHVNDRVRGICADRIGESKCGGNADAAREIDNGNL
jgi:hypothetical protein